MPIIYCYLFISTYVIAYLINIQHNFWLNFLITALNVITVIFLFNGKFSKSIENYNQNSNYTAAITHDLKTPTIANIRALELLLNGKFGVIAENQKSFLNDILHSNYIMLDMLMNMLWLYKFDNNKIAINKSCFSVNELINDILRENNLLLKSKSHVLNRMLDTKNSYIYADKMQIKRIIFNLLTNAINHSYENTTITIKTQVERNQLNFRIISFGKFIQSDIMNNAENRDNVFKEKSDCLSTGLGLYLANSMLKLNKAEFIYNSTPEGKNTFGFTINSVKSLKASENNGVSVPV